MLAGAAWLNLCLVLGGPVTLYFWSGWNEEGEPPPSFVPFAIVGGLMSAVVASCFIAYRMRWVASRTFRAIGATLLHPGEIPRVDHLAAQLAIAADLPSLPIMAIVDEAAPNALTVGAGRRTLVVLTTGLIETLTLDELEAVMAVQFAEVKRLDAALQTMVLAASSGASGFHGWFRRRARESGGALLWLALTWPSHLVARFLRRLAYRTSDHGADDLAITMTRHPEALASALRKVLADQRVAEAVSAANAHLWFEPVPIPTNRLTHEERRDALAHYAMAPSVESRLERLVQRLPLIVGP